MKQNIIADVVGRLNELGIASRLGEGTDIAIHSEFVDAGWSTGKRKIVYEASAYFDETSRTIFLWEFTKETGSGFSFGGDSETSFQMGKTLFRKVKSVQYGPDGKAYEYTLDLGAIPKAFKEAAKAHEWKLKTVLKREKASYPLVVPFNNPQETSWAQGKPAASARRMGVLFWIGFAFLAISAALLVLAFAADTGGNKGSGVKSPESLSSKPGVSNTTLSSTKTIAPATLDESTISPKVDDINIEDYFGRILTKVRKEWKSDAKITSIRFDRRGTKNFESLNGLRVDSDWTVVFYSLSTANEIAVTLDNSKKDSSGVPTIKYACDIVKSDSLARKNMTIEELRSTEGAKFYEFSRPEVARVLKGAPDNPLQGCSMKMSEIMKLLFIRFKDEKITGDGYFLTINGLKGPKLDVYWVNGSKKTRYIIELDTKKAFDQSQS